MGTAEVVDYGKERQQSLKEEVIHAVERSFVTILTHAQDNVFPQGDEVPADPRDIANGITRILLDFSRAAANPATREKVFEGVRTRILTFVERRTPVKVQMFWSPKKHWMNAADSAVDLAELAALQTLVSIDRAVREIYGAGISFELDVEDIEFEFMEKQDKDVVAARALYVSGLARLIRALGLGELFLLRQVSERARSVEELARWRQQMDENYRALQTYWFESERSVASSQEELPSFKQVRRLGWMGTIPPEMRRYYLNRLGRLAGSSARDRVDMVLRNFAGILLHHQTGLLRDSSGLEPVRLSFVRLASGAPTELAYGRVDLRFAPRKLCSRVSAAAPWATKGFVCTRSGHVRLSFRGWHELAGLRSQFAQGWFTVAGLAGTAEVRADFMSEEMG